MKKKFLAFFAILTALVFCACGATPSADEILTGTAETEMQAFSVTETVTEEIPLTTKQESLQLPDVSAQLMTEYFEEVVLRTEYSDGEGNSSLVQKWEMPIHYRIHGDATAEDLRILNSLFEVLNGIEGFPGIEPAAEEEVENLSIHFADPEEFDELFFEFLQGEDAVGAARYWYYTDTNDMYEGKIGYRTDIDQSIRNSVLPEEIINVLGITDTVLREDSIVYQHSNFNTELSDVDLVILKLLYHPSIPCGSDAAFCRQRIAELYR